MNIYRTNCSFFLLIIIVFVSVFLANTQIATAVSPEERVALDALYNSTSGASWANNSGWMGPEGTECLWYGIFCNQAGNVSYLDLSNNSLSGPLPAELGNLTSLEDLILDYNQLTGPIPPEIGNMTNLQTFSSFGNQLTGPIPPEIGNLPNLQGLQISDNQLTGSIPAEIGNLINLQTLLLANNQLSVSSA